MPGAAPPSSTSSATSAAVSALPFFPRWSRAVNNFMTFASANWSRSTRLGCRRVDRDQFADAKVMKLFTARDQRGKNGNAETAADVAEDVEDGGAAPGILCC